MNRWVEAARPRTLPLAVSSILLGNFLAFAQGSFHWAIAILAVLTTLALQILSNFANDLGDFESIAKAILTLVENPKLRFKYGKFHGMFCREKYSNIKVKELYNKLYSIS